ncbi:MAG: hypothetical protein R3C56_15835 [Pirellulaceae bacterium]
MIDAPPVKLEVQFNIDVRQTAKHSPNDAKNGSADYVRLSHVSPVVRALATEQFDNFVKRVRVFVSPERAAELSLTPDCVTQALLVVAEDVL